MQFWVQCLIFFVKFQEFEKPVIWHELGRAPDSAYFVGIFLHVCIIHLYACFPNLKILIHLKAYVLSKKYWTAVISSFLTCTSSIPEQFLLICSPHTACLIIHGCMCGLLCITWFWRTLSSFLQVLFRMKSFITQVGHCTFIHTCIILKIFWIPARICTIWKSHLKKYRHMVSYTWSVK